MSRDLKRIAFGCLALLTLVAAGCAPEISDTGYVGTWSRGESVRSTVAIAQKDGQYLFRWGKESSDGRLVARCDWNGDCVELMDGQEIARFHFRAWMDEESGLLRVECKGRVHEAPDPEVHYVDELHLRDEGQRLVIRTIERSGEKYEGRARPKFTFKKVSDSVPDPPSDG